MSETSAAPAFPVMYRFKGDGSEWLLGVPARDLDLNDWANLEDQFKADLLANVKRSDSLYEQVATVAEAKKAVKAPAAKGKGKKTTQNDPDTNTPGRVDSDVVIPGQAVPPTDEPISEGAPGFVQADTGPTNVEEG